MNKKILEINPFVRNAIAGKKPVVALESTIISHGMPYPQNVKVAMELEEVIRNRGAVPATIAIIDGKISVGLSQDQIEFLASGTEISKASRRDIPSVLARKKHAATTVSATMICASMAGIKFFATGGIGGVHRGVEKTMDISADLEEFSRTPVLVVCAGPKAILDIEKTMEYLETNGIPVIGYKTDQMPAFYYARSGIGIPCRVDTPFEAASIFYNSIKLNYGSGVLVGNPVPEKYAMSVVEIEKNIDLAIKDAQEQGISGQQLTPFLLDSLLKKTGGESLKTNIELVKNNADVCAQIAVDFSQISG
ncbi:MAG: pseudouridine-5'-phosphate glycosidase [Candidatus Rifleibacteriota bacterium]